jgi:DNA-binding Lrp family transcriptional regulator
MSKGGSKMIQDFLTLDISGAEFRVLMCICSDSDDYNSSLAEIATKINLSVETVKRAVSNLKKKQILSQEQVGVKGLKSKWVVNLKEGRIRPGSKKTRVELDQGLISPEVGSNLTQSRVFLDHLTNNTNKTNNREDEILSSDEVNSSGVTSSDQMPISKKKKPVLKTKTNNPSIMDEEKSTLVKTFKTYFGIIYKEVTGTDIPKSKWAQIQKGINSLIGDKITPQQVKQRYQAAKQLSDPFWAQHLWNPLTYTNPKFNALVKNIITVGSPVIVDQEAEEKRLLKAQQLCKLMRDRREKQCQQPHSNDTE